MASYLDKINKFKESLSPSQVALMHQVERKAVREAGGKLVDQMPQLVDPIVNGGERIGGGLAGWVLELGTRYAVDKIGAPNDKGERNVIGRNPNVAKGVASAAIGLGGLVVNLAIPGSPERSMLRRIAANASTSHFFFGADRLITTVFPSLPK